MDTLGLQSISIQSFRNLSTLNIIIIALFFFWFSFNKANYDVDDQVLMAIQTQKRVVIWEKRALKSFVGVPTPSGFDAKSNALNWASSNWSACWEERNTRICLVKGKAHKREIKSALREKQDSTKNNNPHICRSTIPVNYTWMQTSATSALEMVLVSVLRSSSSFPTSNSRTPPALSCRPPALTQPERWSQCQLASNNSIIT